MSSSSVTILLLQDGARRWAQENEVPVAEGYRAMSRKLAFFADELHKRGITRYYAPTNSITNLRRQPEEVVAFFESYLLLPDYSNNRIRVTLAGNFDLIPKVFQERYRGLEASTASNSDFTVHLLVNWSVADEIVRIYNRLGQSQAMIDEQLLLSHADIPEPIDLIIRTGKRRRLSSFYPLNGAYAETCFLDVLFPDLQEHHIDQALKSYAQQERTYGL
ncbi:MAG: undecaprenyl diphosphate synthase family protein [Egibacteraceae bacterium]